MDENRKREVSQFVERLIRIEVKLDDLITDIKGLKEYSDQRDKAILADISKTDKALARVEGRVWGLVIMAVTALVGVVTSMAL